MMSSFNKMSYREKIMISVTLFCVVFYLGYSILLKPQATLLDRLKQAVRNDQAELLVVKEKLKALESIKQDLGGVDLAKGQAELTEDRTLKIIKTLTWATTKARLGLVSLRPIFRDKNKLFFDLACSGYYSDLIFFVRVLNSLPLVMKIEALNIAEGGTGLQPLLKIRLILSTYR